MAVNGKGLAAMGIGAIFVWSGIRGWSVLGTIRDLVSGAKPNQAEIMPTLSSVTGLAGIAEQYAGHAYSYGGAPGKDGSKPWDCSSFANYVIGVKAQRAIPGYRAGTYDGSVHGPTTGQWAVWPGLSHMTAADVQAGDIIVWAGHMGIAVDATHMISALNEKEGTALTPIAGTGTGPILVYGRLNG